jgi:hypothetical protein
MNKNIIRIALFALLSIAVFSCKKDETPFSEGYDIDLPAATVTSVSDEAPFVGDQIVLRGTNLNTVSSVAIGANTFKIISQYADSMRIEVPRTVETGALTLMNKYKREYVTVQIVTPKFYEAIVTTWPAEIERGKPFTLKGENLDLLKEVKIAGKVVSVFGSASPEKVAYSSAGVDLGEAAVIEVTPKAGEKQTSAAIAVVAPKLTYDPRQTHKIVDFDSPYTVVPGDAAASCTYGETTGFFGKGFEVSAPVGNGWNGIYLKIENDNGGAGYDLSTYTHPCFTMLVNTNGSFGYVQPIVTSGGGFEDKHLTGAFGYGDDYKVKTNGWEWRSYDLEALGFSAAKGNLEKFGIQFRGGNVGNGNTDAFYIAVDQILITDGPVNPKVAWDCETAAGVEFTNWHLAATGSVPAFTGYNQGSNYATATGISTGWNDKLGRAAFNVTGLDPAVYANGIWVNFLLNTGEKEGYFQFDFGSGWMHFTNAQGYGDDYKFAPTGNKWVWRSVRIFPGQGDLASFDASKDFTMDIQLYGGNIGNGTPIEVNVDYFVFSTVPLDPTLIPN